MDKSRAVLRTGFLQLVWNMGCGDARQFRPGGEKMEARSRKKSTRVGVREYRWKAILAMGGRVDMSVSN